MTDRIKTKPEIIAAFVTTVGAIIVAFILGYYNYQSSVENAKILQKSSKEATQKQIDAQFEAIKLTNKNYLRSLEIIQNNNIKSIKEKSDLEHAKIIERARVDKQTKINNSIQFLISDIQSRVDILKIGYEIIKEQNKFADKLKNKNNNLIVKYDFYLESKSGIINAQNYLRVGIEKEFIFNNLNNIPDCLAHYSLLFYRFLQIYNSYIPELNLHLDEFKNTNISTLNIPINEKETLYTIYEDFLTFVCGSTTKTMICTITLGLKSLVELNKYLKRNTEHIEKDLKAFLVESKKYSSDPVEILGDIMKKMEPFAPK